MQRLCKITLKVLSETALKQTQQQQFLLINFLTKNSNEYNRLEIFQNTQRYINGCAILQQKDKANKTNAQDGGGSQSKDNKKSKSHAPKITLIAQNQSLTITTLEEAQKLAKRRDLHLTMIQKMDTKTQRPVYKLVTASELLAEELKDLKSDNKVSSDKTAQKKAEKSLTLGARIAEHDLTSRLKNISKWLAKQHEVRVLIQGNPGEAAKADQIFKTIDKFLKEPLQIGKIQQKRGSSANLKFIIVPVNPDEVALEQPIQKQSSKSNKEVKAIEVNAKAESESKNIESTETNATTVTPKIESEIKA